MILLSNRITILVTGIFMSDVACFNSSEDMIWYKSFFLLNPWSPGGLFVVHKMAICSIPAFEGLIRWSN